MISPMDQQGPFIPFEKGVPVPGTLADDEPFDRICFNSSWRPMVVGALKILCRPETWTGTEAEIKVAMGSAHDLISAYEEGCPAPATPDCLPVSVQYFDGFEGHNNTNGHSWFPFFNNTCGSFQRVHAGNKVMTAGLADLCLRFRDRVSNNVVGVHIAELKVVVGDNTLTPVWQVAWDDCVFGSSFDSGVGPVYTKRGFDAKVIAVSGLSNFSYTITIEGPIVCGPA